MNTKELAIKLFNETWDLLDKENRTADDDSLMIEKAHASLYLWSLEKSPLNNQRAEWMVSNVYYHLGMAESCLYHAKRCEQITINNNIGDFDLSFMYECMAKAFELSDSDKSKEYLLKGYDSLQNIKSKEDRNYVKSQLDIIKSKVD